MIGNAVPHYVKCCTLPHLLICSCTRIPMHRRRQASGQESWEACLGQERMICWELEIARGKIGFQKLDSLHPVFGQNLAQVIVFSHEVAYVPVCRIMYVICTIISFRPVMTWHQFYYICTIYAAMRMSCLLAEAWSRSYFWVCQEWKAFHLWWTLLQHLVLASFCPLWKWV